MAKKKKTVEEQRLAALKKYPKRKIKRIPFGVSGPSRLEILKMKRGIAQEANKTLRDETDKQPK